MLRNGLCLVVDMAVDAVDDERVRRYRKALLLGTLREDVLYVPLFGVTEYPSFSHFYRPGLPGGFIPFLWPGPRSSADRQWKLATRARRAGNDAAAFVHLGRMLHVLTDMCIPSHANRVAHEDDPFEWFIEGNARTLGALPVPTIAPMPRASAHIEAMARSAQQHAPDATNTPVGRVLERVGLRRKVSAREAAAQAEVLLPLAAGHAAALLRRFAAECIDRLPLR
ncbi:MAG: hypothetical protein ABI175_14865 [Polyangiales bacterium]